MINAQKFGAYALYTARIYVSKYNWYYMPSSVHKVLIHGETVIRHFAVLPIRQRKSLGIKTTKILDSIMPENVRGLQ